MEETQQVYTNLEGKKYRVVEYLGRGRSFQVEKVIDDNNNVFVLKKRDNFLPFEKQFIDQIKQKNQVLLNIYDYFYSEGSVCIVQEDYNQENLDAYQKQKRQLKIKEAQKIMLQISKQLSIIHQMGYIYQALKPENIAIKEINNKLQFYLCDFGSVIKMNHNIKDRQQTQSDLGTRYYRAPESIDLSNEIDQTIDIWALGVLYYELISGKKLFDEENKQQIFKQIDEQSIQKYHEFYKELVIKFQEDQCKDKILLSMFSLNPENRPNIEQVISYLFNQQKKFLKSEIKAFQNELKDKIGLNYILTQTNEQLNTQIQQLIADSEKQQIESQVKYDKMEQQLEQKLSEITKLYEELQNLHTQEQIKFQELKEELRQKMSLLEHRQKVLRCFIKRDQQQKEQIKTLTSQKEQIAQQHQYTELQYQESIKLLELKLQESQADQHKSEVIIKNFMIAIQQNCDIIEKQKLELNEFEIKEENQKPKVYSFKNHYQFNNFGENESKELINQLIQQVLEDQNYKLRQQRLNLAKNLKENLQVKYQKVQQIQNKLNKINNKLEQKDIKIELLRQQIIIKRNTTENEDNQISQQFENNYIRENSLLFPDEQKQHPVSKFSQHQQTLNQSKVCNEFQGQQKPQSQVCELCQNNDISSQNSKQLQEFQVDQL